jgi:hypothetical protein
MAYLFILEDVPTAAPTAAPTSWAIRVAADVAVLWLGFLFLVMA